MKDMEKITSSLRRTSSLSEINFNSNTQMCSKVLSTVPGFHPSVGEEYKKMVKGFLRMKRNGNTFPEKQKKMMISFAESQVIATQEAFRKIDDEVKEWFR